jgi:hypothetical protein
MTSIDRVFGKHRTEVLRIAAHHGARNLRIFGSVARNEDEAASDIDILVDLEPGRTLLDLVAVKQDLEDLLGREIDVLTEAALSPYLRDAVLKEAVRL